jgi:hypothetical protein
MTDRSRDDDHLDGVNAGAGCEEIWEHLSEHRDRDEDDDD